MVNFNLCSTQFRQRWQKFPAKYYKISCEDIRLKFPGSGAAGAVGHFPAQQTCCVNAVSTTCYQIVFALLTLRSSCQHNTIQKNTFSLFFQGFHRYSTDAEWHVPHFEKMLYDQSQLADTYLNAYQVKIDSFCT